MYYLSGQKNIDKDLINAELNRCREGCECSPIKKVKLSNRFISWLFNKYDLIEFTIHFYDSEPELDYDEDYDDDNDTDLADLIEDKSVCDPALKSRKTAEKELLLSVLNTLDPTEKEVLIRRYGLDDGRAKSLEEVGKMININKEKVRQLETRALRKLRSPLREPMLRELM